MTAERQKRAEWEWLLLGCAPSNRDLPQQLRELLRELDDRVGKSRAAEDE
jgi:hypothetical protein